MAKIIAPYYEHNGITIYCGDCREILPQLNVKADLVLTDPPYGISQEDNGLRELTYAFDDNPDLIFDILPLLKPTNAFYIWCHSKQNSLLENELEKRGFLTRCLAWVKRNPTVMNGDKLWIQSIELCVYGKVKGGIHNGGVQYGHFVDSPDVNRQHPTQKPLMIISLQIQASTNTNDTVLDPFLGSGTTAVAAKILGRKCIGIEISERYCEIAVKRLSQEVMDFHTLPTADKPKNFNLGEM